MVVLEGQDHLLSDRGIEGPPALVVEVISPSTASRDRGIKLERYRHFGVPHYWIVDPENRSIEVWQLSAGASEPAVHGPGDSVTWDPGVGPEALEMPLKDVFG